MRRVLALTVVALAVAAVVEVTVFVLVARWLGVPLAVLLAAGTSVVGVLLLRREGVRAWRRFQAAVGSGEPPGARVADGLVGLVGALLLAVPGLVTDVLGALLLVVPVRPVAGWGVRRLAEGRMSSRLAGDVFGPRRVRIRVRRDRHGAGPEPSPGREQVSGAGPVVEGEIVDPGEARSG